MKQCNGSGSGKSRTVAIVSKVYCQDCQDYLQDNTEQSSIIIASFCFPERADDIVRTPKGVATTTIPQKNNRSDLKLLERTRGVHYTLLVNYSTITITTIYYYYLQVLMYVVHILHT